jgi:hypothetical protein
MAITFGTLTIDKGIEHTSQFWLERINQKSQRSAAGNTFTFDNSRSVLRGVIEIRYITKTEADQFRDFIANTVRFSRFKFDIIPESYDDVGAGIGVTLTDAEFDGDLSTQSIIKPIGKANKFNISLPYYKAIDPTVANVDHEGVVS